MRIIEKYIIKEMLRLFALVLAAVLGIYLMVDFFEKIDNFISSGVDTAKAIQIFVFKMPLIFTQVMPFALLLAVLITLGLMSRNNEIVALKSTGISMNTLLKPILMTGFGFTAVLFFLAEFVVPATAPVANRIWVKDVKKKQMVTTREKNIWMRGPGRIVHIEYYNAAQDRFFGLSLYYFDDKHHLVRRVDAASGIYKSGQWVLFNAMVQKRGGAGDPFETRLYAQTTETLDLTPEDLRHVSRKSEEMGFSELRDYIGKVEREGYSAAALRVDLFAKTAFPFVCVILSVLGTGIGVKKNIREGLPVGIAYGIGIAFLYWVFHSFCLSLGYGGLLPPLVAAWMANGVFLCWGLYIYLSSAFEG